MSNYAPSSPSRPTPDSLQVQSQTSLGVLPTDPHAHVCEERIGTKPPMCLILTLSTTLQWTKQTRPEWEEDCSS